jgi:hypothetical protein
MTIFHQISDFFKLKWHQHMYSYIVNISNILLIISVTGIMSLSPVYLNVIQKFTLYYTCFVLLARFNPFIYKLNKCNLHDRKIAFSAGMTLFVTTSLFHFFEKFFTNTIKKTSDEFIHITQKIKL